jgi:hypothetical protein
MGVRTAIAVVGLALLCAACAGGGGGRRFQGPGATDDEGEGDGPRQPRTQLFISPSGQPFRAPAGQPYPVAAWFAQADRDHDGKLTREEFRADADAWFEKLDLNHDGQISMPEVTHWEDEVVPEITRATIGGFSGGRGGPLSRNVADTRAQGAAMYSVINEPHPIRGADTDFSFSVSKAEWRAAADRRFDLLDDKEGVKDGVILLADLPKTPAQRTSGKARKPGGGGQGGGEGRGRGGGGGSRRGPPR